MSVFPSDYNGEVQWSKYSSPRISA